ncbi:TPA: ABC transporter ATP-binding protein [Streptococcus agalactiae]|uniref:ABC transporter ATP-binding protein n=1 Tax=Streptococcus TaxID=1301 RepID=UPI00086BCAF5|nr:MULTISPECIES: ABC transporter ATP-binding protein [Streptococcus]MDU5184649.1 ABC transporter ATP-binding protein [Peptoniphilus harei]HEN9351277.1 ABC transporter ATP-binding protein [Streptococcus agalactiae]KAA9247960.1 ABC transporter ATP-binding protein [Streptococcus anginosus]KAA9312786.1 ABC transporter ATP-binding protein [Streptococcus anginosus]MCW0929161.1 ABC transporter ATP-binding protein/permease [Streptococcus anginosus]
MPEKELRKKVIGKNGLSNSLLALKIVFDLIPQILLVYLISSLITNNINEDNLKYVFIGIFISFVLKGVFYYFATKVAHEKAYEKLTELRLDIIDHLKKLSLGFFKEHNTGELTNIVQHDVEQVEVYLAHGLPEIMSVTLLPTIIFVAMIFVDWRLALGMIAGVPLMYLVKVLSQKTMDKNFAIYFNHENKMREELMEYVKNISVIKAFAKEEEISERTLKTAREYVYWVKKSMGMVTIPMGLIDIFMEIGVVIVMILGSIFLYHGNITTPNFILSIILSSAFTASISKTATLQHFSIVFKEALKSIGKVLTVPLPTKNTEQGLEFGNIEFKDVNFAYGKDGFELKNINLTFKKNSLNAFVGASGCGKSTVSNLLMGFWDADEGQILINGKDIKEYSQENISMLIGSVQQEVILFDLSIFENIAIGKLNATKEEVIEAAKKARCHDFISALPNGYETRVGEMGVKLSGGEKQRISIARMILKNAPILILDEAMAAVDSENERLIGEAIDDLSKDKTIITIAHHLNTIRDSDQIIVMDKGVVLDAGSHEELMKRCDFYKDMVEAQNKVDRWNLKEVVTENV